MLTLILSLVSLVIGVAIKILVDLFAKSNKNIILDKLGKLGCFVFTYLGTICATAFKLVIQIIVFVI